MLNKSDIELSTENKYTEFADKVTQELRAKLINNDVIIKYNNDMQNIEDKKEQFSQINVELAAEN